LTEPASHLRTLVEVPPSAPPPLGDLHQRVATRRRRRRMSQAALAGIALVVTGVAALPLVDRPTAVPTQVVTAAPALPEVAQAPAGGATLVLQADQDCAYLRWAHAQPGDPPLAGGCGAEPVGHSVQMFGRPVAVSAGTTAAILRGGPSMARYSARLADGRKVDGALATGGWAVVVVDGRIAGVSGIDVRGLPVPEWIVG